MILCSNSFTSRSILDCSDCGPSGGGITHTRPPNVDCVGKGGGQLERLVRVCLGVGQRSTDIARYLQQRCDLLWVVSGWSRLPLGSGGEPNTQSRA